MPNTKHALTRYQVIDKCLANRNRLWNWKDLLDEVNRILLRQKEHIIGKTTLFEDLKDMEYRVYSAPIERFHTADRRITYYRYTDPEYSINRQPLTPTEAEHIESALQVISRFNGLPQFDWLHEWMPRLRTSLGMDPEAESILSFDSNQEYVGYSWIGPFFHAIRHKRVLKVKYRDFKREEAYEREFHPYHLKQYNRRWFAFGKDPEDPKIPIVNLALDRVMDAREVSKKYIPSDIDWQDHFNDVVGVTRMEGQPVKVGIRILDGEQAEYIRTKPLHHSQKPVRYNPETKTHETSITVIPNYELRKLLLSYGGRIVVTSPKELVKLMRKTAESMHENYRDGLERL
jgi:predicted DNA-binding transcriptional regulator YafY